MKFGFIPSFTINLMEVECNFYPKRKNAKSPLLAKSTKNTYSYIYSVVCNQDDVIEFLLKNDIEFSALCHYGTETVIYRNKRLYKFRNEGIEKEMYSSSLETETNYEENLYLKKKII